MDRKMDLRQLFRLRHPLGTPYFFFCSTWFFRNQHPLISNSLCLVLVVVITTGCWIGNSSIIANPLHSTVESRPVPDQNLQRSPLILLTGFDPFGQDQPANSSWEGIRRLDGQPWKGYRLVCRRLPVTWGASLDHLRSWIDELQPVAVISFGQSRTKFFSLESQVSRHPGQPCDNNHHEALQPKIIADGPEKFRTSAEGNRLVKSLSRRGYPIQASEEAGGYRSEETQYCLEYFRSTGNLDTDILFFHVPPLDTESREQAVTAKFIQQFVVEVLETWLEISATRTNIRPVSVTIDDPNTTTDQRQQQEQQNRQGIEQFIQRYFRTWSDRDIDAYGKCFWPNSDIQFIDARGKITRYSLDKFLASQREAHRRSRHRQTEVAESIEIRFEAKLARAIVYWKLTAGPRVEYGYDHFTLMKNRGKWGIVNLVFYATKRSL